MDWECGWQTLGRNANQKVVLSVLIVCKSLAQECSRYDESLANFIQKTYSGLLCPAMYQMPEGTRMGDYGLYLRTS